MLNESEPITPQYARELEVWVFAWYDEAVAANLVRPPYHPDATLMKLLHGYFLAGLSPAEAACACFGSRH